MSNRYYNLKIICDGTMVEFAVDDETLTAFEKSFNIEKEIIRFIDKEDHGEVILRNKKLAGYKKTVMNLVPSEFKKEEL
ncbi:MAG: hypothetical protein V1872_07110 [bacterium]